MLWMWCLNLWIYTIFYVISSHKCNRPSMHLWKWQRFGNGHRRLYLFFLTPHLHLLSPSYQSFHSSTSKGTGLWISRPSISYLECYWLQSQRLQIHSIAAGPQWPDNIYRCNGFFFMPVINSQAEGEKDCLYHFFLWYFDFMTLCSDM